MKIIKTTTIKKEPAAVGEKTKKKHPLFYKPKGYFILYLPTLLLLTILISVLSIGLNPHTYAKEFSSLDVHTQVGLQREELLPMSTYLTDYLGGKIPDLDQSLGPYSSFYNEREKLHMEDVKKLFSLGKRVLWISAFLFIVTLIYELKNTKQIKELCFSYFLAVVMLLCFYFLFSSFNFDFLFTKFHKIFFSNDLWILNPETDLLIRLMPIQFFISMVKKIGIRFGILFLTSGLIAFLFQFFSKKIQILTHHTK